MNIGRTFLTTSIVAILCISGYSAALSRMWNATPQALAQDYVTINDTRAEGEIVLLIWFVPSMLRPSDPGSTIASSILQKYVVLVAVHGKLDKLTGSASFEDLTALEPKDQSGKALTLVAKNDLPPTTAAMLVAMESLFRQSLGPMGAGMKVFVFDSGEVNSCNKGGLSVPVAGENYTWETPIPGCPSK